MVRDETNRPVGDAAATAPGEDRDRPRGGRARGPWIVLGLLLVFLVAYFAMNGTAFAAIAIAIVLGIAIIGYLLVGARASVP